MDTIATLLIGILCAQFRHFTVTNNELGMFFGANSWYAADSLPQIHQYHLLSPSLSILMCISLELCMISWNLTYHQHQLVYMDCNSYWYCHWRVYHQLARIMVQYWNMRHRAIQYLVVVYTIQRRLALFNEPQLRMIWNKTKNAAPCIDFYDFIRNTRVFALSIQFKGDLSFIIISNQPLTTRFVLFKSQ